MAVATPPSALIEVFISYSHRDEGLRQALETHLSVLRREGVISIWHDRRIATGTEWAGQIDERLEKADVILLLISPDFLASDYCNDVELKRAMKRQEVGEARVIPVILRPVDWHSTAFGRLQALPRDGKPVTTWSNRDQALLDVARGIRAAVQTLPSRPTAPSPAVTTSHSPRRTRHTSWLSAHAGRRPQRRWALGAVRPRPPGPGGWPHLAHLADTD